VNLVRTIDLIRSDESLFIVMEYVRGADLRTISWRARLRRKPLSPAAVLHVFMETLAGLAYAHGRASDDGTPLGIIHRDVSPSNILCSGQGEVKLSDFGIAKATTFSSVFYRVRGKVGYMSPEQARNQPLDGRSDLFSLAVCLYETLTGERLFTGDLQTPHEQIYSQKPQLLSSKRSDLPAEHQNVMDKALCLDRDGRYPDAQAFADALRDVARRNGLLCSAPALAAELADVIGPNPRDWLTDDAEVGSETQRLPLGKTLEGSDVPPPAPIQLPRVPAVAAAPPRAAPVGALVKARAPAGDDSTMEIDLHADSDQTPAPVAPSPMAFAPVPIAPPDSPPQPALLPLPLRDDRTPRLPTPIPTLAPTFVTTLQPEDRLRRLPVAAALCVALGGALGATLAHIVTRGDVP
jgi:serine/threonine-protein kinase